MVASFTVAPTPPPLAGFDRRGVYPDLSELDNADQIARMAEKSRWQEGIVDARACLHCGTITTAEHTQTVMQSSFKQTPPSFIDEIQRDLRALVMKANHVILMGYSLPPDDVTYRAFSPRGSSGEVVVVLSGARSWG